MEKIRSIRGKNPVSSPAAHLPAGRQPTCRRRASPALPASDAITDDAAFPRFTLPPPPPLRRRMSFKTYQRLRVVGAWPSAAKPSLPSYRAGPRLRLSLGRSGRWARALRVNLMTATTAPRPQRDWPERPCSRRTRAVLAVADETVG